MALKDIKARIVTVLEGVEGAGMIYARMRPVNVESIEQSQFVKDGVLNCAFVSRSSADVQEVGSIDHIAGQWDSISVHAFYVVNDRKASEDSFDALIDAMLQAIHDDSNYPSYFAGTISVARPPKIKTIDFRHFGVQQALCHHAEITIQVMSEVSD